MALSSYSSFSSLPGIPGVLTWTNGPVLGRYDAHGLHMTAGSQTDLFVDPEGTVAKDNSPRLTFVPDPRFTLSAHVHVDFAATYDAGVLLLYVDAQHWAKLCFEYSPQAEPMIVSVVTNGVSDDCNAVPLTRRDVYLRVTRIGNAFAFHYSENGELWRLVRHFALHETANLVTGFSSQSPTGEGCHARFADIRYAPVAVTELRTGA